MGLDLLNRGSEWHRWEPHIHAPGTILNDQFGNNAWDDYLAAIDRAEPKIRVLGVTDYYSIATYEEARKKKSEGKLSGIELLFPNIEMRLSIGTVKGHWVNVHLLIDPSDPDHVDRINVILGRLKFRFMDEDFGCTRSELIRMGKRFDSNASDDRSALSVGTLQYKVSIENLREVLNNAWARENVIVAVAAGADGSSGVRDGADALLRQEIESFAQVIFSGSPRDREFWLGLKAGNPPEKICAQYRCLKPTIWGCDAHRLDTVGKPELDRFSWVKGAPSFDALRQACIEPQRSFVGESPTSGAVPSQVISRVQITGTDWAQTADIGLNSGLVAIIGARGSGKTALADIIAVGCDAFPVVENRQSFITRANNDGYLHGASVHLTWQAQETPQTRSLAEYSATHSDTYPRARYLSQQFVDELCSSIGMTDTLLKEIERVIFEAHPLEARDGTVNFDELRDLKTLHYVENRRREEQAIDQISEQIGLEREKIKSVASLRQQVEEKKKVIGCYVVDRGRLIPRTSTQDADRLGAVIAAAEKIRGYIRFFANQLASLNNIKAEVDDHRVNRAPNQLRIMQERHKAAHLKSEDWNQFLLRFAGEVDGKIETTVAAVNNEMAQWKGVAPVAQTDEKIPYISADADLTRTPLALLDAEIARLEKLVATDRDTALRLNALNKRIAGENATLQALEEKLKDCEGAATRAADLFAQREQSYKRVFECILAQESVLKDLYAPLMSKLKDIGGTVKKLTVSVNRTADVQYWSKRGEDLLDGRKNPFKGQGTLLEVANAMLKEAWEKGDAAAIMESMAAFRASYQEDLLEASKVPRADQAYRQWSRDFARWLFDTNHIELRYSIDYDGADITKLSPGTRGIVLLLLYLALDEADDRPLIIDQPEENLDPKSIFDELVRLFHAAKIKRQVIIVTHNANLVVNSDADQIIIASVGPHREGGLPPITYQSGGLHEAHIRQQVCDILEGGERAFVERSRRLRVKLS